MPAQREIREPTPRSVRFGSWHAIRASGWSAAPEPSGRSRSGCLPSTGSRTCACSRLRARPAARSAAHTVEEATPEALSRGDIDVFLFSVGTGASRELVPHAVEGGAIAIDKSSAYRLQDGIPLVVPEVNGDRALGNGSIIANPNCCTIPLTCVLKPLHEAAGLARVRVATYQSVSGAGAQAMERLANEDPAEHDLRMDWEFDGEEFDEESKLRAETQKIMELPELPIQATCVRVPVMVGHAEAVWIETEERAHAPSRHGSSSAAAPSVRLDEFPSPGKAAGHRRGARRPDPPRPDGRQRPRALPRERQPPQGRRAERDPDRRARARRRVRAERPEPLRYGSSGPRRRHRARAGTPPCTTRSTFCAPPSSTASEPAELEPRQPDPPGRAHDPEAEVAEEVGREHRLVHAEALVGRLTLRVAVGERLDRRGAPVACLADRREEERLQHPRASTRRRCRRR